MFYNNTCSDFEYFNLLHINKCCVYNLSYAALMKEMKQKTNKQKMRKIIWNKKTTQH